MEFFETIQTRRSVRRYTKTPVPDEVIQKALDAALLAPNSSNMQPWEFYWVRTPEKKAKLVEACLSQGAARTAPHLVVAVARMDTWRRNRKLMLEHIKNDPTASKQVVAYYEKLIPMVYSSGPFNILGHIKTVFAFFTGLFRPIPRGPATREDNFDVVVKTTALACENFMLACTAQGYGTCAMEGFDEWRVRNLLGLSHCHARVVMVISVGETDPKGVFGERVRFDRDLFIHEV